jgi:hypothetical protein
MVFRGYAFARRVITFEGVGSTIEREKGPARMPTHGLNTIGNLVSSCDGGAPTEAIVDTCFDRVNVSPNTRAA